MSNVGNNQTVAGQPDITALGSSTPYFGTTVGDWDTIKIGAILFTGTKIVISGAPQYKLDSASPPGMDGARQTPKGYVPAKLKIEIDLWWDVDTGSPTMNAWALVIGMYKPKPGKTKLGPVTIDHPLLRMYGMSRFYILATPFPRPTGAQSFVGELGVEEYFTQPKKTGTKTSTLIGNTVYAGQLTPENTKAGGPAVANVAPLTPDPPPPPPPVDPSLNNLDP